RILAMCEAQRSATGETEPLDAGWWSREADRIASLGQRVLAFASRPVEAGREALSHADVEGRLTLVGMVGLIDPPRAEAIAAVADCQRAGIRVKMITGDHAGTARAIGRQIGLRNTSEVLTGADLDNMEDGELRGTVLECD